MKTNCFTWNSTLDKLLKKLYLIFIFVSLYYIIIKTYKNYVVLKGTTGTGNKSVLYII